jgi:hypothetical protein
MVAQHYVRLLARRGATNGNWYVGFLDSSRRWCTQYALDQKKQFFDRLLVIMSTMLEQLKEILVAADDVERKKVVKEVQDLIQSFETTDDTVNRVYVCLQYRCVMWTKLTLK